MEAALYRPQTGYYPDLIAEAAALWESLSQNHPFIDGKKRAAFAVMYTFVAVNGTTISADADEVWTVMHDLYESGRFRFDELDRSLRANTERPDV